MLPVPVEARLEFVSPAWIDEARRLLETELVSRPGLATVEFSLCEVFVNPPSHLDGGEGVVSWHLKLDNGRLDVGSGDVAADVRVTADYQVALGFAQIVYAGGQGA